MSMLERYTCVVFSAIHAAAPIHSASGKFQTVWKLWGRRYVLLQRAVSMRSSASIPNLWKFHLHGFWAGVPSVCRFLIHCKVRQLKFHCKVIGMTPRGLTRKKKQETIEKTIITLGNASRGLWFSHITLSIHHITLLHHEFPLLGVGQMIMGGSLICMENPWYT